MNRLWTSEEIEILKEYWGIRSPKVIAKKLKRTETSIKVKAKRLKLGSQYREYLTATDVARIFKLDTKCISETWIKRGLKYKKTIIGKRCFIHIMYQDLIEFIKNNTDLWNANKVELYALGLEEEWLKEKRKKDSIYIPDNKFKKWTKEEDNILLSYRFKYSYKEIGKILGRSVVSIETRLSRMR